MDTHIIAIYCLSDDVLNALGHCEDRQCKMSDAEVMTTAVVAALYFGGNQQHACRMLVEHGYIPHMLDKSRFNRRLHRIAGLFGTLIAMLGELWKAWNEESTYVLDSFPVAVCENCRIPRCRRCQGEEWRGYQASKRRYFYGVKIHLLITGKGQPVEFFLTPGSVSDTKALKLYRLDLPEGAQLTGDKAYNDYGYEDLLADVGIELQPLRKANSKRPLPAYMTYLRAGQRKAVETAGSLITRLMPRHIHAVTMAGFQLKIALFVLASSFAWYE